MSLEGALEGGSIRYLVHDVREGAGIHEQIVLWQQQTEGVEGK